MNTNELIQLIETVKAKGYGHIDITHEGTHLMLDEKSLAGTVLPTATVPVTAAAVATAPVVAPAMAETNTSVSDAVLAKEASKEVTDDANVATIVSPIVGTYYESASPEASAFVKVGDKVKKGDVVCIIEAMKLMNEIESEFDGEIIEVLVQNEGPVEYGQAIYKVRV